MVVASPTCQETVMSRDAGRGSRKLWTLTLCMVVASPTYQPRNSNVQRCWAWPKEVVDTHTLHGGGVAYLPTKKQYCPGMLDVAQRSCGHSCLSCGQSSVCEPRCGLAIFSFLDKITLTGVCLLAACLTSQQQASVSQGRVSQGQVYVLPH